MPPCAVPLVQSLIHAVIILLLTYLHCLPRALLAHQHCLTEAYQVPDPYYAAEFLSGP